MLLFLSSGLKLSCVDPLAEGHAERGSRASDGLVHQCAGGCCGAAGSLCAESPPAHGAVLRHAHQEDTGMGSFMGMLLEKMGWVPVECLKSKHSFSCSLSCTDRFSWLSVLITLFVQVV